MSRPISVRETDGFRMYVRAIGRFPLLDRKKELALARRYRRRGDAEAARALVESSLRYVPSIAAKYRGYGIPIADLVEEGNIGLLEAVRRFDPTRKLRVMTYATFWIRAYIRAFIVKHWSLVGVGSSSLHAKMFFRLRGERTRLALQNGQGGQDLDPVLAERFGTTTKRVRVMTDRLGGRDVSLDGVVSAEGGLTLLDLLADTAPDGESQTAEVERDEQVRRVVADTWHLLDARERLIVEARLMTGGEGATLADLGRRLGLTRERVRQLEVRVKTKLRSVLQPIVAEGA
jgi:RNA polymerase sigma-32 factor